MRRLRFILNFVVFVAPILVIGIGAVRLVRTVFDYLNSGRRLAGTVSAEATRALGRVVRVGDVKITGNLWSLDAANRVDLYDVYVANGPSDSERAFARARQVAVWYNLRQILATDRPLTPLVDEIRVESPSVLLERSAAGRWNYQDIIRPSHGVGRSFVDKVSITNGKLFYSDRAFPHPPGISERPLNTRLDHLEGVVLIRTDKSFAFDISGLAQPAYAREFHLAGSVTPSPLRVEAAVSSSQVHLPIFAERLIAPDQLRVSAGTANVNAGFLYVPPIGTPARSLDTRALVAHGTVQIFDAAATGRSVYAPVEHLNGLATFTTDSVVGNASAVYDGMPVRMDGEILGLTLPPLSGGEHARPPAAPPVVSVRGTVENLDWHRTARLRFVPSLLERLPAIVRQRFRNAELQGRFDISAAGPINAPVVAVTGTVKSARFDDYRGQNIDVRLLAANHNVYASIKGAYAGGQAIVRGTADLGNVGAFEAQGQGRGLNLASLGAPIPARLAGRGDIDFAIRGRRNQTPSMSVRAEALNASVNGQSIEHAFVRADTAGPSLVLRTFMLEDPKAYVVGQGAVGLKNHKVDLTLDADELNFETIVKAIAASPGRQPAASGSSTAKSPLDRLADLQGYGYARTHIGGTIKDPVVEGKLYAFGVQTGNIELDKVTVSDFRLSRDEASLNVVASRYPGNIKLSGRVLEPFSRTPELDLGARVDNLDLNALLQTAGIDTKSLALTGTVTTNTIPIRGTFAAPQTPDLFTVNLQNATVKGVPIRNAAMNLRYQAEGVYVKGLSAQAADGLVVGSGWIPFDGPINFTLHGGGLSLQPLEEAAYLTARPDQLPLIVKGDLGFDLAVTGTLKQPRVAAQSITADNLVYNGFSIGSVRASGHYADRDVLLDDFVLSAPNAPAPNQTSGGPGRETISARGISYNLDTKRLRTEPGHPITIDAFPLERVRELADTIIDPANVDAHQILGDFRDLTGPISATAALGGTLDDPTADITWKTAQVRAQGYEITSFYGSALVDRNRIIYPSPQSPDLKFTIESPYGLVVSPADSRTRNVVVEFDHDNIKGRIRTLLNPGVTATEGVPADLSVANIDLSVLQRILGSALAQKIEGTGDLGIQARGLTAAPELELTANFRKISVQAAKDLTVPPLSLDRLYIEQATVKQGSIEIGSIRAIKSDPKSGESFTASATASLGGFTYTAPYIPADSHLAITGDLPAPFLAAVAPGYLRSASRGGIVIRADVLDLRGSPSVSGLVALNVPRLEFDAAATGLQDLKATLLLKNDRLSIGTFSAHTYVFGHWRGKGPVPENDPKRRGSDIDLTGSLPLGLRNDQTSGPNDGIVVRIFDAANPNGKVPVAGAKPKRGQPAARSLALTFNEDPIMNSRSGVLRGTLRTDPNRPLRIRGSVKDPLLTGRVELLNALITPPPEQKPGTFAFPIVPSFDLALQLGPDVRIRTAQLDARLLTDRDIVAHGRLLAANSDLTLDGTIQIVDGKLKLPAATFSILPGASLRVTYPSNEGGYPVIGTYINLRARGNIVATSQYGQRKRYEVTVTAQGPLTGENVDPLGERSALRLSYETVPNDLASSQQLPERLAGAIIGVDSFDQAGRNPGQAFANVLSNVFTGSVLPGVFDKTAASLGFEELSLGYDAIDRLSLNISRHLFGPLYVSYYRTLTASQQRYDLKLSFRFKGNYQLSFDLDEQHTQKLLLEGVWKF